MTKPAWSRLMRRPEACAPERCGISEASLITGISKRTLQDLAPTIPGASRPHTGPQAMTAQAKRVLDLFSGIGG